MTGAARGDVHTDQRRLRAMHPILDADGRCGLVYDLERTFVIEVPDELRTSMAPALASADRAWFLNPPDLGWDLPAAVAALGERVSFAASVDALVERLSEAGVELRWADEGPGVRRGHIDDCFGNRLELVDPGLPT